jgi:Rrf2 family protein
MSMSSKAVAGFGVVAVGMAVSGFFRAVARVLRTRLDARPVPLASGIIESIGFVIYRVRPAWLRVRPGRHGPAAVGDGPGLRHVAGHDRNPGRSKEAAMAVTQKCQYALRALLELARREGHGAVPAGQIAENQAIPKRFLEVILNQLRQGGFVASQRGKEGGFYLARPAAELAVGAVIRFMDGPISPVDCHRERPGHDCPLAGNCVFRELWDEARLALERVYDTRSLADLAAKDRRLRKEAKAGDYVI